MAKKKKTSKTDPIEAVRASRGSWFGVNPVTKVIPDKTKYSRKEKHKNAKYDW
jgi:hypothetical protein